MSEFGFIKSEFLVSFFALALIAVFLQWTKLRIRDRLSRFGQSINSSKFILELIILVLLSLSLARPYWGVEEISVTNQGREIVLLVDVSRSMLTNDASPTRLEVAKHKILDLIDQLSNSKFEDRLGIVLFAGEAYLYCPLTSDYAVLDVFARSISSEMITSQGSNIQAALETAIKSFETTKAQQPQLLLISDGEDLDLHIGNTLSILQSQNLKLNCLGIGTSEGKPIELSGGHFIKDEFGNIVISKLREPELINLCIGSGGIYKRATLDPSDLVEIFGRSTPVSKTSEHKNTYTVFNELGAKLLWLSLLLILLSFFLKHKSLIYLLIFLNGAVANAQERVYDSYQAYLNGDYKGALPGFESYFAQNPNDLRALQALASTYYKLGDYAKAKELFELNAKLAKSGREKFEALYNLGNTNLMSNDGKSAVENYEHALKIKPDDEHALHNLEVAKKLLEQKQEKSKEQQKQDDSQQSQSSSQESSDQASSSESQATHDSQQAQSSTQESGASTSNQSSDDGSSGSAGSNAEPSQTQSTSNSSTQGDANNSGSDQGGNSSSQSAALNNNSQASLSAQGNASSSASMDAEALKQADALSWLESLSDTPVLLRRKTGKNPKGSKQTW